MTQDLSRPTAQFFYWLRHYGRRSASILVLSLLAGLAEGLGIVTLLPLLAVATGAPMLGDDMAATVRDILAWLHVPASLGPLLLIMLLGLWGKAALQLESVRQAANVTADIERDFRLKLVRALMAARWTHFTSLPTGQVINSLAVEAEKGSASYSGWVKLVSDIIQMLFYIALAVVTSWQVTAMAMLAGGLMFLLLRALVRITAEAGQARTDLFKSMTARLADGLLLMKPLKSMARESSIGPLLESEARLVNAAARRASLAKATFIATQEPILASFLAAGAWLALAVWGQQMGELLFIAVVFQRVVTRAGNVQSSYQNLVANTSAMHSLMLTLNALEAAREDVSGAPPPPLVQGVRLAGVRFAYGEAPVLQGHDFDIPARRLTVLLGPSGAGKTTVIDLVVGLIRPQAGAVLVDGQPLAGLDLAAWRGRIGYVPQEVILLNDSLLNNVTLGDARFDRAAVERALRQAGAWDFVEGLPQGLDSPVGERGGQLSGGQRQRIAIARALLHQPALLILDEATSALDAATATQIVGQLRSLLDRTTILAVTHQPQILAVADQVWRLEPGGVIRREAGGMGVGDSLA